VNRAVLVICFACTSLRAQSTESLEFAGPDNAPIYVIDGQVSGSHYYRSLLLSYDWNSETDPSLGLLTGSGNFSAEGGNINLNGRLDVKMSIKSAGSVVRIGGKMSVQATGVFEGYTIENCVLTYSIPRMSIDPVVGRASGYVSASGRIQTTTGKKAAIHVATTFLPLELPDSSGSGWDSPGDWRLSVINASVDGKGKITGTGEFAVLDSAGDPYDVIGQKITGTLKGGIVTLTAAGNSKATSKIKVILTYRESDDQTVAKKSSVSAYGQSRKF